MFEVSPYLYLLQGLGGPLGTRQPEPADPFAPDPDARRRARNQGLTALGMALLEGSGRGDLSGGLARGIAGFSAAAQASHDRDRQLRIEEAEERRRQSADQRAQNADARAAAQETDRDRLADVQFDAASEELAAYRDAQARGRQLRERTGKSAEQMVAEINALAASRPDDAKLAAMAKRAVGYSLGDDSDVNKLAALHAEMTAEAFEEQDYAEETALGMQRARTQAGAGFGPIAEGQRAARAEARADAGLGMERERLGLYRQEVARRGDTAGGTAGSTSTSAINAYANDVEQELATLIKPMIDARNAQVGKPDIDATTREGHLVTVQPMTPQEVDALRRQYEPTARANVERRRGQGAAVSRRLTYNPQTGELE